MHSAHSALASNFVPTSFLKKKFSSHNSHLTQAEVKEHIGRIWSRNIVPDNAAKPESSLSLLRMYEIRVVG